MAAKTQQLQIRVTPEEKATLRRLADASGQDLSGYVLSRALPDRRRAFDALLEALAEDEEPGFSLAELNDLLTGWEGTDLAAALEGADPSRLSPYLQNYVAAMLEEAAQRLETRPPRWARGVPPLEVPRFATSLPGLRLHLLRASPVAFKRRNIFIDASLGARV